MAEIHGKLPSQYEGWEDVLTSNVFSFFKYSPRTVYLKRFLHRMGIDDTSDEDLQEAEFNFWPTYPDGTEPDLVILVGQYYILIEAKFGSDFGPEKKNRRHQLVRELNSGFEQAKKQGRRFILIALTADCCFRSEKFREVPPEFRRYVRWTNWQAVAKMLQGMNKQESQTHIALFAKDLYLLLVRKGLRGFQSFADMAFSGLAPETLFFAASTAKYRGDFIGFAQVLGSLPIVGCAAPRLFFQKTFFSGRSTAVIETPRSIFYREVRRDE